MEIPYRYKAKVLRVVDGDTLDIEFDLGMHVKRTERVRLHGIDTPETYGVKKNSHEYVMGTAAKNFVVDQVAKARSVIIVDTHKDKQGKYGRYVATVWLETIHSDDEDTVQWISLNDWIVEEGYGERRKY